jgi:hypothetical protein
MTIGYLAMHSSRLGQITFLRVYRITLPCKNVLYRVLIWLPGRPRALCCAIRRRAFDQNVAIARAAFRNSAKRSRMPGLSFVRAEVRRF